MTDTTPPGKDVLYSGQQDEITGFVFDDKVAAVFPDMITRSVPGYSTIIRMIGLLAGRHARQRTLLYDLGCSLGAATAAMRSSVEQPECRIVAVDSASAMIDRAEQNLAGQAGLPVDFVCADVREVVLHDASVVVLNFTLQFLPPADRLPLLRGIRRGMVEDAILVVSEKIAGVDEAEESLLVDLHHAFKRANGYSNLEISQKRNALENVLLPETIATHVTRLKTAGFSRVDLWFQCFNFISLIARP